MVRTFGRSILRAFVLLLCFLSIGPLAQAATPCERIISAAPSITEILFDMGLGDRVVGRTRFCAYPLEVKRVVSIGGFLDPNLELIASLRPTQVILLSEQAFLERQLKTLGIPTMTVDHRDVEGIRKSYSKIGDACEIRTAADERLRVFDDAIEATVSRTRSETPTKTMVVVDRSMRGNSIASFYMSGSDGFYNSVMKFSGAAPAHSGKTVSIPTIGGEGLRALRPEAIIDIAGSEEKLSTEVILEGWARFKGVPAVDNRRILVLRQDFASIPGPRTPRLVWEIAKFLHPSKFNR